MVRDMTRLKVSWECSACGLKSPKWLGKCPDCGQWNGFVETREAPPAAPTIRSRSGAAATGRPVPITDLPDAGTEGRIPTGMSELDRILGGGFVPGSVTLLGGEPGIGKSTLLLQVASALAAGGRRVLYASGEESLSQIQARARRLGTLEPSLFLLAETTVETILAGSDAVDPAVLVVDSIQTTLIPELGSAPGTPSQVREVTGRLVLHAKSSGRATILVGHVTKDGQIAGPKTMEHLVDTVIYFEGDARPPLRVLRGEKNRFGATGDLAVFEMTGTGLKEVAEPSALLLRDRPSDRPGTVVTAVIEGSRAMLLEVQALVAPGFPGALRRTAVGVEGSRLAMLCAVLTRADIPLADKDVFVNVAGGVRIQEPAADLAVACAIASSLRRRALPHDLLVVGEVGLTGEIRSVARMESRLQEAARHGFLRVLVPRAARATLAPDGILLIPAATVEEAMDRVLS